MILAELPLHVESRDLKALIGDTPWRSDLMRLSPVLAPRGAYALIRVQVEENRMLLGDTAIESLDLARHLAQVEHAAVMAVTLGEGVDEAIATASPDRAIVFDAIASAAAEGAVEELCGIIARSHPELGELGSRYSPGYGDWSLKDHSLLSNLLDVSALGIRILDSGALVPRKSITAIAGFGGGSIPSCQNCPVRNCKTPCRFRRV